MANPHSSADALTRVGQRTSEVDSVVRRAFAEHLAPAFAGGIALLAVGGYGRRELFPYSDVDLLILVERTIDTEPQRAALSSFLRTVWDAGLRLSQSVRTVAECSTLNAQNVELSISLIDQRFLDGDRALYERLAAKLPAFFHANRAALISELLKMTRARHAKYQHTIYHLEPNIKEIPGGLRDLHVTAWLERLRGGDSGYGNGLGAARKFFFALRSRLHDKYRRDANTLTFDDQEALSDDPAAWMREYFRHAREIHRAVLRQMELADPLTENPLLRQFRDWRSRLSNADFSVSRERVFFRAPHQLDKDPELALRMFAFVARHGIPPAIETEHRIAEHLGALESYFAEPRPVWPLLNELLALPHAPLALRKMHETGVLFALFPEWRATECLVVRDFYHRYTVDEHSLIAVESVAALRGTADKDRRRFAELLHETNGVPLLFLALLFHDVGKAQGYESHPQRSSAAAHTALTRIGAPENERRTVEFLVEQHLALSAVMLGRDLDDPAVIRELAGRLGTVEGLKLLALLTFGDIDAVNPTALTAWRLEQLWRVYLRTHRELVRELETDRIPALAASAEYAEFLSGLPTRYMRMHGPEEVAVHARLESQASQSHVALELKRTGGVWQLTVVAADRPRLFAAVAGALSSFGMNIVKAEAFSNSRHTVVDTFVFTDRMRTLELNPVEIDRLKATVQRVILGREDVRKLLRGRAGGRPKIQIQPAVAFDSEACDTATLIEIVTEDRPGLLYELTAAMSDAGCDIEVVLIDTEAGKAVDVFYVNTGGAKLSEERQSVLRATLLDICGAAV